MTMQPIEIADDGIIRFKENKIVRYLLDVGGITMNDIASMPFTVEDREQFAQLIGYSVSGFGDLSYVRKETVAAADAVAEELLRAQAGIDPTDKVTVCSKCLRACCWQGVFMCDAARDAGTVEKTVAELRRLDLEDEQYWSRKGSGR